MICDLGFKSVLVICAHPDDEVLGCGGTIAKLIKKNGCRVYILFCSDGETARGDVANIAMRRSMAYDACGVLGVDHNDLFFLDFPDNQMDSVSRLVVIQAIEKIVRLVSPDCILTHHWGDLNIDHQIVHEATLTACRPIPGAIVRAIFSFEVPSATDWRGYHHNSAFLATVFEDISNFQATKMSALECYQDEMKEFPHARSLGGLRALMKWRGVSVGLEAAEAFSLIRYVA